MARPPRRVAPVLRPCHTDAARVPNVPTGSNPFDPVRTEENAAGPRRLRNPGATGPPLALWRGRSAPRAGAWGVSSPHVVAADDGSTGAQRLAGDGGRVRLRRQPRGLGRRPGLTCPAGPPAPPGGRPPSPITSPLATPFTNSTGAARPRSRRSTPRRGVRCWAARSGAPRAPGPRPSPTSTACCAAGSGRPRPGSASCGGTRSTPAPRSAMSESRAASSNRPWRCSRACRRAERTRRRVA